jgi:hypothetical protein
MEEAVRTASGEAHMSTPLDIACKHVSLMSKEYGEPFDARHARVLATAIHAAIAAETERCAKIAERQSSRRIASLIRARSTP